MLSVYTCGGALSIKGVLKTFSEKLIAKGTIEEKIIKLQQMKKELAEEILSGDEIKTASFQREELLELLEERF